MAILYSFIIPHKNSPELLQRCVDSIPDREDIEVIVVDDNSDRSKKPQLKTRKNLTVIQLDKEKSKGAGRARNVGLETAKGKWILFADADDCYVEGLLNVLDPLGCVDDVEVYYFDYFTSHQGGKPVRANYTNGAESPGEQERVKYTIKAPWNKMVLSSFMKNHKILFEEVPNRNDVFFSYQVGFYSEHSEIVDAAVYVYTTDSNGITKKKRNSDTYYLCQLKHCHQSNEFYSFIHHPEWRKSPIILLLAVLKRKGFAPFFQALKVWFCNLKEIRSQKFLFVSHFLNQANQQNKAIHVDA